MLAPFYNIKNKYEVGVDECARGPMFGRLYTAAVILPNEHTYNNFPKFIIDPSSQQTIPEVENLRNFEHEKMKDSKKIHSVKKMKELSDYIKTNALGWYIGFVEPNVIDDINIRQAVLTSMRESIHQVLSQISDIQTSNSFLLIDGNDFSKYDYCGTIEIPHMTVEKGDNTYSVIAAASILAKNAHDEYIFELCEKYPDLKHKYDLHNNVGYGTKKHMEGIREYGITQWHRKSFGICKNSIVNEII